MRHKPNREPKFHMYEMLVGAGKSIREELMGVKRGCWERIAMGFFS